MNVRKILTGVIAICLTAGLAFADREEFDATVEFTQEGSVSMDAQLRNLFGEGNPEQITWETDYITLGGETSWMRAEQSIEIDASISDANGGIQIYSDNQAIYEGDGNPAGLVNTNTGQSTLPLAWRVSDKILAAEDEMPGEENWDSSELNIIEYNNPEHHIGVAAHDPADMEEEGGYYPVFLWMKDLNTPDIADENTEAFTPGEDYVTVWDARGIQHAEDTFSAIPGPAYVYLGANFSQAVTPAEYKADKIVVEVFTE